MVDTSVPLIKIYGERNTGTNYLSRLLQANLHLTELPGVAPAYIQWAQQKARLGESIKDYYFRMTFHRNLGWKHAKVLAPALLGSYPMARRRILFLTLTKNPYSWVLSLHKRPYHGRRGEGGDLESFVTSSWRTVARECMPELVESPIELWNQKNGSYQALQEHFDCLCLKYEDLLADPLKVVEAVAAAAGARAKRRPYLDYQQSTKDAAKSSDDYRDYYLAERWRPKLSPAAVELINARLDRQLARTFGYQLLS